MKVPGQCCEEWVCDDSKDALEELEGFFGKEFGLDASEGELTRNNELIAIVKGGLKMLPGELISGLCYLSMGWEGYCWNVFKGGIITWNVYSALLCMLMRRGGRG